MDHRLNSTNRRAFVPSHENLAQIITGKMKRDRDRNVPCPDLTLLGKQTLERMMALFFVKAAHLY